MIPPPSPDLRARVLDAARREPSPPRAVAQRADALTLGAALAVLFAVFAVLGADLTTRPRAFLLVTALGWTAIAAVATWRGVHRAGTMLGRSSLALALSVVMTAPVLVVWMTMGTRMWPGTLGFVASLRAHLVCFAITALFALIPFSALLRVRRGSDPVHPAASGAALGAACGAWGSVLIDLHCPISDDVHVMMGHVLPVVVFALVGVVAGKKWLAVR